MLHTNVMGDTEILILSAQNVILSSPLDASIKVGFLPLLSSTHSCALCLCGAMAADYLIAH